MNFSKNQNIRVRMAPSPTGVFHVGSARTALFNYLFARHHGGTLILRIEDTDATRSDDAYEQVIYDAMKWLRLEADEGPQNGGDFGPYRQSERFDTYREYSHKLIESGAAYFAYETPDELAAMKAEQAANKKPPRYNGAHRDLMESQRAAYQSEGRKPVIRLRVPEGETAWRDLVYGDVSWKNAEIDDFVIGKSDGAPTYNFACVVDDALMKVTHVIRGEDGLSNTPRQIVLYQALGFDVPQFAHLPFLLGTDRKKLSKRHGPVGLLEYAASGILPDAMTNYLALLGWNPGGGETQEIFSREELIERFSLDGVNKAGAIFDVQKLEWMNVAYLKAMPLDDFIELAQPQLANFDLDADREYSQRALEMARERIRGLDDVSGAVHSFFRDDFPIDEAGAKKLFTEVSLARLEKLRDKLASLTAWNHDAIEAALRELATALEIKPAELIHPARLAVSGRTVGPSVFELLAVLGRARVLARLEKAGNASD